MQLINNHINNVMNSATLPFTLTIVYTLYAILFFIINNHTYDFFFIAKLTLLKYFKRYIHIHLLLYKGMVVVAKVFFFCERFRAYKLDVVWDG